MEKEKPNQEILNDKKDIESWLHQADPSLTVHELPTEPQISFRKNVLFNSGKTSEQKGKDVRVFYHYNTYNKYVILFYISVCNIFIILQYWTFLF